MFVRKRDGRLVEFDDEKILESIKKAALAVEGKDDDIQERARQIKNIKKTLIAAGFSPEEAEEQAEEQFEGYIENGEYTEYDEDEAYDVLDVVVESLDNLGQDIISTVEIQDFVEKALMITGHTSTAREYIIHRSNRERIREMNTSLMRSFEDLTFGNSRDVETKRENANIDGDSAMGTMLKYGSEGAKKFNLLYVVPPEESAAHSNGDIHIHDLDFLSLTETCCQIDLEKLFKGGFNTGHGFLREPGEIRSYGALACIAIQSNQNDQHGGQSVPNFDYYMAPGVAKTFIKELYRVLKIRYPECNRESEIGDNLNNEGIKDALKQIRANDKNGLILNHMDEIKELIKTRYSKTLNDMEINSVIEMAMEFTKDATHQAMEAVVHNLNSMHSRAGAQVPFSSLNFGTDTSEEGRMASFALLKATEEGLGNGETPIFPISIFKMKSGVSYNKEDPNYDLFKESIKVSAKRLFPNFSNLDAPYNAAYYVEGDRDTECAYMGCRTRVMANSYDPNYQKVTGRGNLSFTSINLPRLGIKARGDLNKFFEMLDEMLALVHSQLLNRFEAQCRKHPRNYPFLMGQGVWKGSDHLGPDDDIREILRHGTLTVGFIGLAECLIALTGKHHGESEEAQKLGLRIVEHMRKATDKWSAEERMNYSVIATPAEGLSGRFVRIDKKKFGVIPGITDKEYYTNSFHVPVYFRISAFKKINIEAPYHNLCNGGHISYIEMDGDPSKNLEAFEKIVRHMHDAGIGYGAINHPVDRDPVCGYVGIIDDVCPRCGRKSGEPMTEEMWQKIKGYPSWANSDYCGTCGGIFEESDRVPNPLDE